MPTTHAQEIEEGKRFAFGENWARFLRDLNDERIATAEKSLLEFLDVRTLKNLRFIDIGSGSGLFSLAARRLGARVCSLDYDPQSVACTRDLKRTYFPEDAQWEVLEGSALDAGFLRGLGKFDVVYSWGVLHHTGRMWDAIRNAQECVDAGGLFFIAIYNDQGGASRRWTQLKKAYNSWPAPMPALILGVSAIRLWGTVLVHDTLKGRPLSYFKNYQSKRGMSPWEDLVDWVGGYPFEVARPDQIFGFLRPLGFTLEKMTTLANGHGCNQFLFRKQGERVERAAR